MRGRRTVTATRNKTTMPATSGDDWRSPLVVRLAELMAAGLTEQAALGRALDEQVTQHAQTCIEDCWLGRRR